MIRAVADTHALIWYVFDDPRLSPTAISMMDAIEAAGDQIAVSSISLIEIIYLIEKHKIDPTTTNRLKSLLELRGVLIEVAVDRGVSDALATIPRAEVPDMPDRIIAATAVHLGVPLISRDGKIRTSSVRTIW